MMREITMFKSVITLHLAACLMFAGCDVRVRVGEEEGVDVKAPGVDVKVNDEEGVNVKAPGVDVKVNDEEGVNVKAPGADVEVTPQNDG
jgi:hypothetical protein